MQNVSDCLYSLYGWLYKLLPLTEFAQNLALDFIQQSIVSHNYWFCCLWLSRCGHYIFVLFLLLFFSSPNLSGRRMDVYHTSTHDVVLVRI